MRRWHANILILLVSIIWGTTFIVQKTSTGIIPPQYFTGMRFLLGTASSLPFAIRDYRLNICKNILLSKIDCIGLILIGTVMYLASVFQQIGIASTSVTNAAFLTSMYVVLVPMLSYFIFSYPPHWSYLISGIFCLFGIYLLGGNSFSSFNNGDLWILASAFFYSIQVILISIMVSRIDAPVFIATIQFFITGILGLFVGYISEDINLHIVYNCLYEILYAGIISSGLAFTLQAISQNYTSSSEAAIIMSAEAVFASIFGVIFLDENFYYNEYCGCVIILMSIIGVQIMPVLEKKILSIFR